MWQARVRKTSCPEADGTAGKYKLSTCLPAFSPTHESQEPFGNSSVIPVELLSAFQYQHFVNSPTVWGHLATYHAAGYPFLMNITDRTVAQRLADLLDLNWIDNHTRAVNIDIVTYSANIDTMNFVTLLIEFSNSGAIVPSVQYL
jgi:hypothetical protein